MGLYALRPGMGQYVVAGHGSGMDRPDKGQYEPAEHGIGSYSPFSGQ